MRFEWMIRTTGINFSCGDHVAMQPSTGLVQSREHEPLLRGNLAAGPKF
jgi:hypothetical protein